MSTISDFRPSSKKVYKLIHLFNASYIKSISHILEISLEILDKTLFKTTQEKILFLNSKKLLNSFLYFYNSELIEAVENEQICKIKDLFSNFCNEITQTKSFFLNYSELSDSHQTMFKKVATYEYHTTPEFYSILKKDFDFFISKINTSLKIIENSIPDLFQEIRMLLGNILLFNASSPKAGSSFDFFGTIYINTSIERDNIIDIIDFIIHETSHLYLYLICSKNPLTLNNHTERYKAPFRDDERPISGIYHATFVLTRLIYSLKILITSQNLSNDEKDYAKDVLQSYIKRFFESILILKTYGNFTKLGKNLIQSCEKFVSESKNSN